MRRLLSLLSALVWLLALGRAPAEDFRPGVSTAPHRSVGLLIVWDTGAGLEAANGRELGRFLGGLRPGDRIGVVAAGPRPRLLQPLSEIAPEAAAPAGYAIAAGLVPVGQQADIEAALETSLEHLASLRRPLEQQALVIVGADPEEDEPRLDIAARLVLDDVIVHVIRVTRQTGDMVAGGAIEGLAASSGGRSIAVATNAFVLGALALIYDSLRLAAADLAQTQVDVEGPRPDEDFSFLDQRRTIEQIAKAAAAPRATREAAVSFPPPLVAVTAAAAVLLLAVLAYLLFLGRRLTAVLRLHGDLDAILKDRSSPSFARLSQAMSRLQHSWSEAEKHVQALSLDLEDYGIESWEIEKRLLDNYASLADSLFLLIDHLELQGQAGQAGDPAWFRSRLRRILDDENIHEIAAAPGDEAVAARHVLSGTRPDASPPGTVLELIRRGWVKRRGTIGDDDLVLRKAEVVVSSGPVSGGGAGEGKELDD